MKLVEWTKWVSEMPDEDFIKRIDEVMLEAKKALNSPDNISQYAAAEMRPHIKTFSWCLSRLYPHINKQKLIKNKHEP